MVPCGRPRCALGPGLFPILVQQPLVENAVRHGLESRVDGGGIDVRAERNGDLLRITASRRFARVFKQM